MQDIIITSDEVLNSLLYGSPFCVIIFVSSTDTVGPPIKVTMCYTKKYLCLPVYAN